MNVYEKLMNVQTNLKSPKSQENTFGHYKYRSCEDILNALKPLLAEVKAILTLTDTIEHIGERFYVKATATFVDIEKGDKIEVSALAREDESKKGMDLAQVTGSVSSYARKYSLNGLFCIDDTKDADAMDNKTNTEALKDKGNGNTPPPNKDDTVTTEMLVDMAKRKGYTEEQLCKRYKATEVKYIKKDVKKTAYDGFKILEDKK
jgi:hypothetical protein